MELGTSLKASVVRILLNIYTRAPRAELYAFVASGEKCLSVALYAAVILDDALLGFDDKRAKAALELLRELSKERQIILFTCQSREKMLLEEIG